MKKKAEVLALFVCFVVASVVGRLSLTKIKNMKQIFSLATLLLISLISFAQQPNFEWAVRMGGTNHDQAESIAVDAIGNVYATGSFQNQTDFDPSGNTYFLNSFGFTDIFVSKTDGVGDFIAQIAQKLTPGTY